MIATVEQARGARSIEDLLSNVSASRLGCFHRCRLQFYFRYVAELPKRKTPALHLGSCVHHVLQAWNKSRWRKHQLSREELHQIYLETWADQEEPVRWKNDEAKQKESGWKLLEQYFSVSTIKPDEKPDAVEVSIEADLSKHGLPTLVGILDLVQKQIIIDYKSSATTPNAERVGHMHEIQTSSYAVLYRSATGMREKGIELHSLVKTKKPKIIITAVDPMMDNQQIRLFKSIESYVRGLESRDFVPSPGIHCFSCEHFNACRKWH